MSLFKTTNLYPFAAAIFILFSQNATMANHKADRTTQNQKYIDLDENVLYHCRTIELNAEVAVLNVRTKILPIAQKIRRLLPREEINYLTDEYYHSVDIDGKHATSDMNEVHRVSKLGSDLLMRELNSPKFAKLIAELKSQGGEIGDLSTKIASDSNPSLYVKAPVELGDSVPTFVLIRMGVGKKYEDRYVISIMRGEFDQILTLDFEGYQAPDKFEDIIDFYSLGTYVLGPYCKAVLQEYWLQVREKRRKQDLYPEGSIY